MRFTRLKLSGFKSFVDPTELHIDAGLTGIVGPNGCGKSNLVEALRWVMGESSARRLRGGEMDDIIFGGNSNRAARNIAEVSLLLDGDSQDTLPAANDSGEIEVVRRIDRGMGSSFRLNGREVRARDVQLLFADASSGARSAAMVSQGQVGAIISAKPAQRRYILEDASGISGLHSRRHEAELRLRAAEQNLERLDDVIAGMDSQLAGLKRQIRQVVRYRAIGDRMRRTEAQILHYRWSEAESGLTAARTAFEAATAEVRTLTAQAAQAATRRTEAAAALPGLRQAEAEAGAALHRLQVALEGLDTEAERIEAARQDAAGRARQLAADIARERALADEATQACARLSEERKRIDGEMEREGPARAQAQEALDAAAAALAEAETAVSDLTARVAAAEAERAALRRRVEEIDSRLARLDGKARSLTADRDRVRQALADDDATKQAASEVERLEALAAGQQTEAEAALSAYREAEAHRTSAELAEREARERRQTVREAHAEVAAEVKALRALVAPDESRADRPVLDEITVTPGFETALAAALGNTLEASTDPDAAAHWRAVTPDTPDPALPNGLRPLSEVVEAPAALARRLAQIGIVDAEDGATIQPALLPGQRGVSREGDLWRWDGYTRRAGAPSTAAQRLAQRNRLTEIEAILDRHEAEVTAADAMHAESVAAVEAAVTAHRRATDAERAARDAQRTTERSLAQAREKQSRALAATADRRSRLTALEESIEALAADRHETEEQKREAAAALAGDDAIEAERQALAAARNTLAEVRTRHAGCRDTSERLAREAGGRRRRRAALDDETQAWTRRGEAASEKLRELEDRGRRIEEERATLEEQPGAIAERRTKLTESIAAAETERRQAADRLSVAEQEQAALDSQARRADTALASAREEQVRLEGRVEQAEERRTSVASRITERLDCAPSEVLASAGLTPEEVDEDLAALETAFDRLTRERDGIGPVNLRAEQEAESVGAELDSLQVERSDLLSAIAKLRGGIGALNREARERLNAAFDVINGHFRDMFVRLFGGGEAHLTLTDSDDPLEAGLEIMASPPGKRLQSLSLLSGGEQALTALALIFAVFLTRPAPVCVLDEVDAPLDDANVERFCNLIGELAHSLSTRFLVITHHRVTMAKMDRLFGVTMAERGISQLVSVDLTRAHEMRAAE